jgi:hypothetical protein
VIVVLGGESGKPEMEFRCIELILNLTSEKEMENIYHAKREEILP